jgi:xylulokinase
MGNKCILAFDLGTGGNKSVLYHSDGTLLGSAFAPYDTFYPQSGWAEQQPLDWWESIVTSTKKLLAETKINKSDIACISMSGHGIGVIPVDKEGNLLRDKTLLWSDGRALAQSKMYFEKMDYEHWYEITGAGIRPDIYIIFKIMWHRDNEPELYKNTYKFIGTKDYINMKMTGNILSDFSDASWSGVQDLVAWNYSEELLEPTGVDREKLPELYPSTHIVGDLLPKAAEELGLNAGIPIICGGYDGSCTALGAGNYKANRVYNYVGSSSWISAASDKPIINKKNKAYCYCHVVPEMINSTVSIFSAGGSYQWFRDILCKEELSAAKEDKRDVYEIMGEEALQSPVGSNNLIFNPSLIGGGTAFPSPHIRGAFLNLGLEHTKSDLVRSVMEGVALDLRFALDTLRRTNLTVNEIRIVGGGSKSELWRQIFADVYNTDIVLTNIGQEAAALGAATIAGVGAGLWKDFSIVDDIAKTESVKHPIKENVAEYEKRLPLFQFASEKLVEIGEKANALKIL